jgi:DNA (cytosine-5)-methyltransferase 3A
MPRYFILENVASMKKIDREKITEVLREVYPDTEVHMINSALVSAQNRKRLYWTNIP